MFSFAYPWVLFIVLLLPLVWYYLTFLKKNPAVLMPSSAPFKAVKRRRKINFGSWFYLAALAFMIVALARPREGNERMIIHANGIDIILALDLSGSMQAIDVPPKIKNAEELNRMLKKGVVKNRLEEAKIALIDFVGKRPNDRIGLIGFADYAYVFAPMTLEHGRVAEHLRYLEPGIIGDATSIAAPIASAVRRLNSSSTDRKVMVLFTDGANTANIRVTPLQAAELAKAKDVKIYTVGIGSRNAFMVSNFGFQPYHDQYDAKMMKSIAEITGGQHFHAGDESSLESVMEEINKLEKTNVEAPKTIAYKEFAPILAAIALGLMLLGFVYENAVKIKLP